MTSIDLNCDMGEGVGNEAEIMPFISSCNISCGLHAGSELEIRKVIDLAIENDVSIGAHPSFDDRVNFGRKEMDLTASQLCDLLESQLQKFESWVKCAGGVLMHAKPHGALYNMAATSSFMSKTIVKTLVDFDPNIAFMGMAETEMMQASENKIRFIPEGFADRKYQSRNQLTPRNKGGLLTDPEKILDQVSRFSQTGQVETEEGVKSLIVESLCVHGDTLGAVEIIQKINQYLVSSGIEIRAVK